jgi:hypothetical protein
MSECRTMQKLLSRAKHDFREEGGRAKQDARAEDARAEDARAEDARAELATRQKCYRDVAYTK